MAVYIGMGPMRLRSLQRASWPRRVVLSFQALVAETEEPVTRGEIKMADERPHANVIDAAAGGASDG